MLAEYIQYFRDFAVNHPQIKHVAAAESDDYPTPGDRRFTLFSMDEVVKSVRSAMWEGPSLHLHRYDRRTGGSSRGSMRYTYIAGLLITQKVQNNSITSQVQASSACEGIVDDFINKLQTDSINGIDDCSFVFKDIFWDQIEINPVGPVIDNRYGWWVQFSFLKNG
jgi:hypothetical protein